jgi:hypothetical protein
MNDLAVLELDKEESSLTVLEESLTDLEVDEISWFLNTLS